MCRFLLIAAFAVVGGCSSDPARGPSHGGGADESSDEEVAATDDTLTAVDVGTLDQAPTAPASWCASPDLALCLGFDGSVDDASGTKLAASTSTGVSFVAGRNGQAASFDATSALRYAPNAAFDLPADGATIEAWISRKQTGADAVVFDDDARFSLTIDANGHVWCKSSGGAVLGTTVVPAEQWVHVACVVDKGALRAYVRGVVDRVGTGSITASPMSTAAVGGNAPSGEPFVGLIDTLRVFRTARTAEQIAAAAKGVE